uniref:Uncharacterized protein n=1 Tax=Cacopsylla melanoneura TaxID=428564 RepID=A0A8D8R739_9HEMI
MVYVVIYFYIFLPTPRIVRTAKLFKDRAGSEGSSPPFHHVYYPQVYITRVTWHYTCPPPPHCNDTRFNSFIRTHDTLPGEPRSYVRYSLVINLLLCKTRGSRIRFPGNKICHCDPTRNQGG